MKEKKGSPERAEDKKEKKEKIRVRYRSASPCKATLIPATRALQENIFEDHREKRVAIYARVSTDDPKRVLPIDELFSNRFFRLR